MKVGRNDPCPCGSGRKVKRCCGVEGVRRLRDAAGELFTLALHFPRCRPASTAFEAWAAGVEGELTRGVVEEGLGLVDRDEGERLAGELAAAHPGLWPMFVSDLGGEERAVTIVVMGGVAAALEEHRVPFDVEGFDVLEHDPEARADPVDALALVLAPLDLWSVVESATAAGRVDAGESYAAVADDLATDWHDARLAALAERLRDRLPDPDYPAASAALEAACDAVASSRRLRRRLRAELLLDSFPTVYDALRAAA